MAVSFANALLKSLTGMRKWMILCAFILIIVSTAGVRNRLVWFPDLLPRSRQDESMIPKLQSHGQWLEKIVGAFSAVNSEVALNLTRDAKCVVINS